jgi:hypothetical protein
MADEPARTAEARIAGDPRSRELTDRLRELYRLCEQEPQAGALCRVWTRSRTIASDLVIEWEPVATHIRSAEGGQCSDDPDALLRALRGLVRVDASQDQQRMVVRLLARALYELSEIRAAIPRADELCRCWERCEDLAHALAGQYEAEVTFRDPEQWNAALATGSDRDMLLERPWAVAE